MHLRILGMIIDSMNFSEENVDVIPTERTDAVEQTAPLSAVFIDFVSRWLDKSDFANEKWPDQLSEQLIRSQVAARAKAKWRLERLLSDERAQSSIEGVYQYFQDLMSGRADSLKRIHRQYQFHAVVGAPRTGGSYLTAELFSALGYEPTRVPAAIAHDGFPDAQPTFMRKDINHWVATTLSASEYLVIVEMYFSGCGSSTVHVPKKLTKGVYAGSFFNTVLGRNAEYFVTIRHPIPACISTYEKSGGLPADGLIKARSNIEKWIIRDLVHTGVAEAELRHMDYFEAYVRSWEQYYITLAFSGLTAHRVRTIVPFARDTMESTARLMHARLGSNQAPRSFVAFSRLDERHPQWISRAEEALQRVGATWRLAGLSFPYAELGQCA